MIAQYTIRESLLVVAIALVGGLLMSTDTLNQWAQRMEFGPIRSEAIRITENIERVSEKLGLSQLSQPVRTRFKSLQTASFPQTSPTPSLTTFRVINHNPQVSPRHLRQRTPYTNALRRNTVERSRSFVTITLSPNATVQIWGQVHADLLTNVRRESRAPNTPKTLSPAASIKPEPDEVKRPTAPVLRSRVLADAIHAKRILPNASARQFSVVQAAQTLSKETHEVDQVKKPNVLIVGDSLMGGVGPRLKRLLRKEHGFPNPKLKWKASTGLSRPDYFDWPKTLNKLLSEKDYDVVVAIFGTNDTQPVSVNRKSYRYGTKAWFEHYRKRVVNVLDMMCKAQNRSVYWIGLPTMRSETFNDKVVKMNALYREELSRSTCGKYIPMDKILSPDGQFSSYLRVGKKRKKVRAGDGIHLSFTGYDYVARRVIDTILAQTEPKILNNSTPVPVIEHAL